MITTVISKSKFILMVAVLLGIGAIFTVNTEAQIKSYDYSSVAVDINILDDSTVEVTEEISYRFTGEFHAMYRDITLEDRANIDACKSNPALQCGGFEFIDIIEVLDNEGNVLNQTPEKEFDYDSQGRIITPPDEYSESFVDDGYERRLRVQWVFSEPGIEFDNEVYKFTIKYKVYGSIGYFPDDNYDLFYWNAIFPDREETIENVKVDITFPEDIGLEEDEFTVLGQGFTYYWDYDESSATLSLESENLLPFEEYTILAQMPRNVVDEYATINLNLSPTIQRVYYDGIDLGEVGSKIAGFPEGDVELVFTANGYKAETVQLEVKSGETTELDIDLSPSNTTILKWTLIAVCNVLGCLLLPIGLLWFYNKWRTKGKDISKRETIIPLFSPPENIRPYLLGSLKDEKVDIVDITSTIIDLAYRGYIKIREFEEKKVLGINLKAKDFELIKLKKFDDLVGAEKKIIKDIFDDKERITTSSLKNKFYKKLPSIRDSIYDEMVSKGYFETRPDKVRNKYIAGGVILAVLSFGGGMFLNILLPVFVAGAMSGVMLGIIIAIAGSAMPAKTQIGSKIFMDTLGFKMYMETAEKHRMQNLTPETFEKYLSYALVFGIEKSWAEKFKDIYTGQPDWYEGSQGSWNAIYLANALSDFNTTTGSSLASAPSSSSGSSGGGWSGGGGFSGGFSGGGGGGGGGGAW